MSLDEVNAVRRRYNRRPLVDDSRLAQAASELAVQIARTRRVSHADFRGRLSRCGYSFGAVAENSGLDSSVRTVLADWLQSADHRINLLAPYEAAGLAVVPSAQGLSAVVLILASPPRFRTALPEGDES